MKKILFTVLVFALMAAGIVSAGEEAAIQAKPLPVKVLLLPKFEVGAMAGDFPGEAQYYYEQYLTGAGEYDIPESYGSVTCKIG